MYCQYCGKQIKDGLRFCPFCGENQDPDEGYRGGGEFQESGDTHKHRAKKPWLAPVILLLVLSFVGALAFGAYSLGLFDGMELPEFIEDAPILSKLLGGGDESPVPVGSSNGASATEEQTAESEVPVSGDGSPSPIDGSSDPSAAEERTTAELAAPFPKEWTGSYEGVSGEGEPELHDMYLSFSSVGDDGHVKAVCTIRTNQNGVATGGGSYDVEGDIDWESKEVNLWWVSWSSQGTLATKRHFRGTFNSTFDTVIGSCETLGGKSATSWRMWAE